MNTIYRSVVTAAFLAIVFGASGAMAEGLPTSAVMQFGNQGTGSPFPPGSGHDLSAHAADKMVPRTVTVAVGGTVTFPLNSIVHGIGVYDANTQPADIDTNSLQFLNCFNLDLPYINDGGNRLATFAPTCANGNPAPTFQFTWPAAT